MYRKMEKRLSDEPNHEVSSHSQVRIKTSTENPKTSKQLEGNPRDSEEYNDGERSLGKNLPPKTRISYMKTDNPPSELEEVIVSKEQGRKSSDEASSEEQEWESVSAFLLFDEPVRRFEQEEEKRGVKFSNTTLLHILKSEAEFSFMRQHSKVRCSGKPIIQLSEVQQILNLIRAPRVTTINGVLWTQSISSSPVSCEDSHVLENKLDELLEGRRAKVYGICPIRRALYDDCFDEVHRHIALESGDRAILLLRCRLEMSQTIHCYAHLFGSSEAYIMRQNILRSSGYHHIVSGLEELHEEVKDLKITYESLLLELDKTKKEQGKEEAALKKKLDDDMYYHRTTNIRLKNQQAAFLNFAKGLEEKRSKTASTNRKDKLSTSNSSEV